MFRAASVSWKGCTAASFLIKILAAKPIRLQDGFGFNTAISTDFCLNAMRYALCFIPEENAAHQDKVKKGHFRMESK